MRPAARRRRPSSRRRARIGTAQQPQDRGTFDIAPAEWPGDRALVRTLFREYIDGLKLDLTFQGVEDELAGLPGKYAEPQGIVLLARGSDGAGLGCVALRPIADAGACEMKRLYVRPEARGRDLGRGLATAVIRRAQTAGYARMYLDTLAPMTAAQQLYATLGFRPTVAYYDNPLPGARYLVLDLLRKPSDGSP